ncbi:MAG: metalloregulator ArsR/SmtB family transcription factor [Syntrophaceae bacterium]|nr:metalloregulator ArsR/SmtB family transcription factor [Syntrophaceae bacterium]
MNNVLSDHCCPGNPRLQDRDLVSIQLAQKIRSLFKLLSNVTRLRILHALSISSELKVGELSQIVCMKPQAVSNQLQKLLDSGVLFHRRDGLHVYYSIADQCLIGLLEQGLCLIEESEKMVGN